MIVGSPATDQCEPVDRIKRLQKRTFHEWDHKVGLVPETLKKLYANDEDVKKLEQEAVPMLRQLLYVSEGGTYEQRHFIRQHSALSAQDTLSLYGFMFGVPVLEPKPFRSCNATDLEKILSTSEIFANYLGTMSTSMVLEWSAQLEARLPIGLSDTVWNSEPEIRNQLAPRELANLDMYTSVIPFIFCKAALIRAVTILPKDFILTVRQKTALVYFSYGLFIATVTVGNDSKHGRHHSVQTKYTTPCSMNSGTNMNWQRLP